MNWEEISAVSTFITMIVIAATAIAAVIQLRHMRAGNAITGFLGFLDKWSSPEARAVANYVFSEELSRKLNDPAYREELLSGQVVDTLRNPEFQYMDFWESIGMFIKLRYVPEDVIMDSGGSFALRAWNRLAPVIALLREARGNQVYDNFEYLASRAQLWDRKHPDGTFPKHTPHLPVSKDVPSDSGRFTR
ncbi:MAG TPA: hypothetical protein VEJ41_06355 [Candidatus Acidoferrales bacterium]|nr:hypothetical protein [Candidatus Acidoferrales bacterium]